MREEIRVGIVGSGYIANFAHLPAFSKIPYAKLCAICDKDIKKAEEVARRFRIRGVYDVLEEMLSKEDLELVDICLPPQEHKRAIMEVLERGINCLVEKPLTVTVEEADEVIALAQKKGVGLYVIHNYSAVPAVRKAKNLVKQGKIGEIVGVHINHFVIPHERYFPQDHWCHSLPGEYFGDLAPHLAMLLVEFMGPAEEIKATAARLSSYPFRFDELRITARNSKALGTIACSLNSPTFIFTMDIIGTKGTIHVSGDYQAVICYTPQSHFASAFERGLIGVRDILTRVKALIHTSVGFLVGRYKPLIYGHRYLIEQSILAIKGKGKYPIDLFEAREAVRLLQEVFKQIGYEKCA